MSHNFKPGDLALVINSNHCANLGQVVELLRFDCSEKVSIPEHGARCFTPNPDRMPYWVIRGKFVADSTLRGVISCTVVACPQSWLMPLRGEFTPEQHKSQEVIA